MLSPKKKRILDLYLALIKKVKGRKPTKQEISSVAGLSRHAIEELWGGVTKLDRYVFDNHKDAFIEYNPYDTEAIKNRIIKWYVQQHTKLGRTLSRHDVRAQEGEKEDSVTIYMINNHFGGIVNLEKEARAKFPQEFKDQPIRQLMNETSLVELRDDVKKYKRFIVTTAVTGTPVNKPFFAALKRFAEIKKAKLLILLCSDPAKSKDTFDDIGTIDPILASETIIFEDTKLNNNLHISTIKLSAKAINPLTGLKRISKKRGSFIYASPKFFLEYTSVRNNKDKWPHALMTTGSITAPEYRSEYYMSQKLAYLAEFDHTLGCIYLEIEDEERYYFRQIECLNEVGEFYFEDKKYTPKKTVKARAEAMVLGDIHVGATCPLTRQAWLEIVDRCKPKKVVLHDAFNGHSINHHIENDIIERHRAAISGQNDLAVELRQFSNEISVWANTVEEVIMVPSNHNDWLDRWLRKARYVFDPLNHYTGVCLAKGVLEGNYALKYAVEEFCGNKQSNIVWLGRNDDYFIGDVQINCHGDVGVNGSKGTLAGMENAYHASVSGHGHTAGIIRRTKRVGTSTYLQEDYNNGPGTWTNTSCIVYPDGSGSLYNAIGGKWELSDLNDI